MEAQTRPVTPAGGYLLVSGIIREVCHSSDNLGHNVEWEWRGLQTWSHLDKKHLTADLDLDLAMKDTF